MTARDIAALELVESAPAPKGRVVNALDDGHGRGLRRFRAFVARGILSIQAVRPNLILVSLTPAGHKALEAARMSGKP
jgi:hypothetical protein